MLLNRKDLLLQHIMSERRLSEPKVLLKLVYVLGHISHYDCLLCIESGCLASSRVVRHPVL